jgi:hypothetical protein
MAKRTQWHIECHYLYPDGTPGTITQDLLGLKAAQEHAEYVKGWVLAHKRTIVSVAVTEIKEV